MKLNEFLDKLPVLQRINNLLVCEVDAQGMRGAVFHHEANQLNLVFEAHAESNELQVGVKEIVEQLKRQGWAGKHAILLTPAVIQQLIELPIPPKNKLMPEQIAEQVRWELEPFVSQAMRHALIGQILVQLHYITPAQIETLAHEQNQANVSLDREISYQKLGEMAVQRGFVSQNRLNDCLSRQSWFNAHDDELHCGWLPQSTEPNPDTQTYTWLVTGMGKSLLRQWQAAFTAQGVKLQAYYPLVGNAMAMVANAQVDQAQGDKTQSNQKEPMHTLVFELHAQALSTTVLLGTQVMHVQHTSLHIDQALAVMSELFHSLTLPASVEVVLVDAFSRSEGELTQMVRDLQALLGTKVRSQGQLSQGLHPGLMAAAQHVCLKNTANLLTYVPVGDPPLPLLQQPMVRMSLGLMLIVSVLGVAEISLQSRKWLIASQAEGVKKDLDKVNTAIARIQAKVDEVKTIKENMKSEQAKIKTINQSVELLSIELPKRNQTLNQLLSELLRVVSDDVVVDKVSEDTIAGFTLSAWALNEKSAQEFAKNLQLAVHPLGFKLKDITVSEQTGRLGLLGYAVNFNMTALSDEAWREYKASGKSSLSGASGTQSATPSSTNKP